MQQQVIIVGGEWLDLAFRSCWRRANIAVKLLEAVKYPNYDDQNVALIIPVLMRVIRLYRVVVYRFIRSWGYGMHYSNTRLQSYKFTLLNKAVLVRRA